MTDETMKRPLLAISGKRFSGKDTLAALLVESAARHGVTVQTYAFAAECKRLFVAREAARGVEVELERLQNDRAYKEHWRPLLTAFTVESLARDPLVFCRSVAERIEASSTALALARNRCASSALRRALTSISSPIMRSASPLVSRTIQQV